MEMNDTRFIAADPSVVWAALMEAEVIKESVPGCEEVTGSPEEGFDAVVVQKVGPVKAKFSGHVSFSDIVDGQSLTLTGEGKGGAAGFAKGVAHVTLAPAEEEGIAGTQLGYQVEAKVGGKLAQLGSRIIDGFARKMADEFFDRFQDAVEGDDEDETDDDVPETEETHKKGWFKRMFGSDD